MTSRGKDWLAVTALILVAAAFAVIAAVSVIEMLAGCGESYVDAAGQRHLYECVFLSTKE